MTLAPNKAADTCVDFALCLLYDLCEDKNMTVYEYIDGIGLDSAMVDPKYVDKINMNQLWFEMSHALQQYLVKTNNLHTDLKLDNIMVSINNSDNTVSYKLIDFGNAVQLDSWSPGFRANSCYRSYYQQTTCWNSFDRKENTCMVKQIDDIHALLVVATSVGSYIKREIPRNGFRTIKDCFLFPTNDIPPMSSDSIRETLRWLSFHTVFCFFFLFCLKHFLWLYQTNCIQLKQT